MNWSWSSLQTQRPGPDLPSKSSMVASGLVVFHILRKKKTEPQNLMTWYDWLVGQIFIDLQLWNELSNKKNQATSKITSKKYKLNHTWKKSPHPCGSARNRLRQPGSSNLLTCAAVIFQQRICSWRHPSKSCLPQPASETWIENPKPMVSPMDSPSFIGGNWRHLQMM